MSQSTLLGKNGREYPDLTGDRFGRLVVVAYAAKRGKRTMLVCRCDCGAERIVDRGNLASGKTRSCGCAVRLGIAHPNQRHGMRKTSVYRRWSGMIQRCTNPKSDQWEHYGGRGIRVCERWLSFEAFHADMGDPPAGTTLDRIDVDGNYEPGNCRWATAAEQARNRRTSTLLTHAGKTQSISDWSDETGINRQSIRSRILNLGWSVERALTTPVRGEE